MITHFSLILSETETFFKNGKREFFSLLRSFTTLHWVLLYHAKAIN